MLFHIHKKSFLKTLTVIVLSASLSLSSCLLPPSENGPKFLSNEEFETLTELTKSRELVQSGRLDDAELILRKLIRKRSQKPIPYNDLGYLLYLESRFEEAEPILKKSINLQPIFIAPRLTLARVYIANGNFEDAFAELDNIEQIFDSSSPSEYLKANGEAVSSSLRSQIARFKASSYYLNGQFDEAVCHSDLSKKITGSMADSTVHLRLLMSLEMIPAALTVIDNISASTPSGLTTPLLFDQSMALFSMSKIDSKYKIDAETALDRVIELAGLDQEEVSAVRLLRYDIQKQTTEFELTKESLLDEVSNPCKIKNFDTKGYWPKSVLYAVKSSYKEVCSEYES